MLGWAPTHAHSAQSATNRKPPATKQNVQAQIRNFEPCEPSKTHNIGELSTEKSRGCHKDHTTLPLVRHSRVQQICLEAHLLPNARRAEIWFPII